MIDMKTKFVAVFVFGVSADDLPGVAREATLSMQRQLPLFQGFTEGIVMATEDKTQLLIVTQWDSRESWAASRWNDNIEHILSDMVESTGAFQVHTYEPLTVVRAN